MTSGRKKTIEPPPCGLYRTGASLRGQENEVPAGLLIMFHNHSNRGIPMVQKPNENINNHWDFHDYGPGVEDDDAFIEALEPLREQGIYYLKEHLHTPDQTLPKFTMVQLGYNVHADPILFVAQTDPHQNGFFFKDTGYQFESLSVLELLGPSHPIGWTPEEDNEHQETNATELLQ